MKNTELMQSFEGKLQKLKTKNNLRCLPEAIHHEREIEVSGLRMLNLSSNDYLGLATDKHLREEFLSTVRPDDFLFSSSSSRLLTGNFAVYTELEQLLARMFEAESALVFGSGYHMNSGILPAIADSHTLILADKFVHASIIDGIRLSEAHTIRYRHNNYEQLESLLDKHTSAYEQVIVVTESIFSMDGDEADLRQLVRLKRSYPNVMLYVDEAHAIGVRGVHGLGCAEEQGCISEIDFLCGTFGKALASVGAYVICRKALKDYLVNKMRTLIFTTALPPINIRWTMFVLEHLDVFAPQRDALRRSGDKLRKALGEKGYICPSTSHIVPVMVGDSGESILRAEELQRKGFYVLPVRPPTVPEGTSRLRLSLTAALTDDEIENLITCI